MKFLRNLFKRQIETDLEFLIARAEKCGLPRSDVGNARELLNVFEYGVSFDTIATQLYEYDITIDQELFHLALNIQSQLEIAEDE